MQVRLIAGANWRRRQCDAGRLCRSGELVLPAVVSRKAENLGSESQLKKPAAKADAESDTDTDPERWNGSPRCAGQTKTPASGRGR
jgi:hypothetical protein